MTWADVSDALQRLIQWVRENPYPALALYLGLTVFRGRLQEMVDAVAGIATRPLAFVAARLQTVASRMKAWSAPALTARVAQFFAPLVAEPHRFLLAADAHVVDGIAGVRSWPVVPLAAGASALLSAVVVPTRDALRNAATVSTSTFLAALTALRGDSGQWVGWRVIGAFLFTVALAGFTYADVGLLLPTFAKLLNVPDDSPSWLHNLAIQFGAASFLSFAMMGVVLLDFIGVTHFGPWTELRGAKRTILLVVVLLLFASLFTVSAFISAWRANEVIVPPWISPERSRELAGWALTLLPPLMLVATALIGWGLAAMPLVLWLLFIGLLALVLRLVGVVAAVLVRLLEDPFEVAVRGLVRFLAGATEIALRGLRLLLQATGQIITLLGVAARSMLSLVLYVVLGSWMTLRGALHGISTLLEVVVRGLTQVAEFLKALVRLVTQIGWILWNWLTSFDWARKGAHLQPIADRTSLEGDVVRGTATG